MNCDWCNASVDYLIKIKTEEEVSVWLCVDCLIKQNNMETILAGVCNA